MSDIKAELKAMLGEFPAIRVEEEGGAVVASCPGETAFKVALLDEADEITVFLEGYHQHFPRDARREALGLFFTGLSDTCRIKVSSRGGIEYKWIVETANFEGRWSAVGMLMNPFAALAFWRPKSQRLLQNSVVGRSDIERLFPEARRLEEEPALT